MTIQALRGALQKMQPRPDYARNADNFCGPDTNPEFVMPMLERTLRAQAEWSTTVFHPASVRGPVAPLKHLAKEVEELLEKPDDLEEYADAFLLLCDALRRSGYVFSQLVAAAALKQRINELRRWPENISTTEPVPHIPEGT